MNQTITVVEAQPGTTIEHDHQWRLVEERQKTYGRSSLYRCDICATTWRI